MSATRYGLAEWWDDLEDNYNHFIAQNSIIPSSEQDKTAYERSRKAIKEMIDTGREAQSISLWWDPLRKATLGLQARHAFKNNFGPEETPPVEGLMSLAFLKNVILPHIENCQRVEYDYFLINLCSLVGIDLAAEAEHAKALADVYKRIISEQKVAGDQFRFFHSSDANESHESALGLDAQTFPRPEY